MQFTKAIHLISGEVITITEEEFRAVAESIEKKPEGFLSVQGQLINKRSIAKIGNHHATPEMKKWNESNLDRRLIEAGRQDLVEGKRKILKDKVMNQYRTEDEMMKKLMAGDPEAIRYYNSQPDEPKKLESGIDSSGDYWIDEDGIKHHS